MIKFENYEVTGWEHAIRGMRNPMNSWEKSDSEFITSDGDHYDICGNSSPWYGEDGWSEVLIGEADHTLMMSLAKGGPVHAKYLRMITVYVDITAPLYWWKEFDTYKVGTVANSCSTMHKIHEKEFTMDDFSHEHLLDRASEWEDTFDLYTDEPNGVNSACCPTEFLKMTCGVLNFYREKFLEAQRKPMKEEGKRVYLMKKYWWQMIQLLPSSYNQKRTVMLNYEVLANIYKSRKTHKLDEWRDFCVWIEGLPYSELITGELEAK